MTELFSVTTFDPAQLAIMEEAFGLASRDQPESIHGEIADRILSTALAGDFNLASLISAALGT